MSKYNNDEQIDRLLRLFVIGGGIFLLVLSLLELGSIGGLGHRIFYFFFGFFNKIIIIAILVAIAIKLLKKEELLLQTNAYFIYAVFVNLSLYISYFYYKSLDKEISINDFSLVFDQETHVGIILNTVNILLISLFSLFGFLILIIIFTVGIILVFLMLNDSEFDFHLQEKWAKKKSKSKKSAKSQPKDKPQKAKQPQQNSYKSPAKEQSKPNKVVNVYEEFDRATDKSDSYLFKDEVWESGKEVIYSNENREPYVPNFEFEVRGGVKTKKAPNQTVKMADLEELEPKEKLNLDKASPQELEEELAQRTQKLNDIMEEMQEIEAKINVKKEKTVVGVKKAQPPIEKETDFEVQVMEEEPIEELPVITERNPDNSNNNYQIPPISLLHNSTEQKDVLVRLEKVAKEKADVLVIALANFNLNVKIANILIGPNITKYEIEPEVGVKVAKFSSLVNDLALALAVSSLRIEAPIPGKAAVGIEVPNEEVMMISLRSVLESKKNKMDEKLQVGLGKDITGESIFLSINKTPHMLVAGATGSGKSVCINSMIVSILLKATPDEVKMVMIDPKKVELAPYNDIPHLLTPVVTDPKQASIILNKMVAEMEYRYDLFAETNTRNIEGYNQKVKNDTDFMPLPYIVIIVDELADLMMVASSDVETSIARLTQMARAAGMHLIVATQRPSTDVITGLIKSNIPTRIAFSVSSSIDSRTILDSQGAEKLLGKGDMLLSDASSPVLERIQGAYLSDEEIMDVVETIKNQYSKDEIQDFYDEKLDKSNLEKIELQEELDELYDVIEKEVIELQRASASHIQRKYRVGYNRAQRIIDQLEANGVISASEGTKPRKVLKGKDELDF